MNLQPSQDSPGPERLASVGPKTKKALFYKGTYAQASFLLLATFALVFPPMVSQASLFSYIVGEKADAADQAIVKNAPNSQTIALLEASPRIDPLSTESNDTTIYNSSALAPETGPLGTVADVALAPETDQISLYVVKSGDTISSIAKMFGVSTSTIRWANDLASGQSVAEGAVLTILPISGVEHTITKNDTLKKIAARYGADMDDVASFNGITEDTVLEIGSTIIVPDGEVAPVETKTVKPTKTADTKAKKLATAKVLQANLPTVEGFIRPIIGGRKSQGLHDRYAIDLAAPIGTPIMASAGGTVLLAKMGYNGGYGNYVVVKHDNGTQTLYAHMSKIGTTAGATVQQGEVIGYVGSTGRSTGPHVHFEVRGAKNPGVTPGVWER